MGWADQFRRMGVRANAETPLDARTARDFGAEGIGLCRTEHMFFDGDRIVAVREMILADAEAGRRAALARLLPFQRQVMFWLFRIMAGLPVTIRLLDPPLHEFLPHSDAEIAEVAASLGADVDAMHRRAQELSEANPMLGHRGCRLGVSFPEIYEMQARAIFEAVAEVQKKSGSTVIPEIMIPLVATRRELDLMKEVVDQVAAEVGQISGQPLEYLVGTMIELPRAALTADRIAEVGDFFSFGTNDLTQMTFGFSRDDVESRMMPAYLEGGLLKRNPFETIDQSGVGELVHLAAQRGRKVKRDLKLGVCGEHGGDPESIGLFYDAGLDYVSCSPFRVPIARLSAAQAVLGGLSSDTK